MSKPTSSREKFLRDFEIMATSGVGVVIVHTQEPYRVLSALKQWAFGKKRAFLEWNCKDGWGRTTREDDPEVAIDYEGTVDPTAALLKIGDAIDDSSWKGVFAMMYPHWGLRASPVMIQCLKQYVQDFSELPEQRVVLIVPPGFNLPKELENDIPLLDMELPYRTELREVYDMVIRSALDKVKKDKSKQPFTDDQIEQIINLGAGMTEGEFEVAVSKAAITNKATFPDTNLADFCKVISETKVEVVKRSEVLELIEPGRIEEIGGLDLLKKWIKKLCKCFEVAARAFGVDLPKGFVCIGPPGTGKSLVARAVAAILGLPLIRFKIANVFAGVVGESEGRVRQALKMLRAMSPCVVWLDEMDKAGVDPTAPSGDSGVARRIMGSILTEQQENNCGNVWVLTANRPIGMPPELLRPGRMDAVFALLTPNPRERLEVLRIHLGKRHTDPDTIGDLNLAVNASRGYVSAEIEGAIKEAKKTAYDEGRAITGQMIADEFKNMKPISIASKKDFLAMTRWATDCARPSTTPEPEVDMSGNQITSRSRSGGRSRVRQIG